MSYLVHNLRIITNFFKNSVRKDFMARCNLSGLRGKIEIVFSKDQKQKLIDDIDHEREKVHNIVIIK